MNIIKLFGQIITIKTFFLSAVAVLATQLAHTFGILAEFPLNLIGIAVVFPIVFSIGGAYKRREVALSQYANLKAHGRSLFLTSRDWAKDSHSNMVSGELKDILADLMLGTREMFHAKRIDIADKEIRIYEDFSRLSRFIVSMEDRGLSGSGVSRSTQFLSKMMISFENMKHIFQYRTPKSLRAYSKVFIVALPVIYGPHFAQAASEFSNNWLMFVMPVLLTTILVSLDNIQDHLENPFDFVGADDVFINVEKFVQTLD
jgi:hypothetical protein